MDYSHLVGLSFGRLTVIGQTGDRDRLECRCACGSAKVARLSHLRAGTVKSCGCLLIDVPREVFGKTLASTTLEYKVWDSMKARCYKPTHPAFACYGGRGITVCARWLGDDGFAKFLDDMGPKPTGSSIDRIDNNGGYSPDNCRWTDRYRQANNRRVNVRLTDNGEDLTLAEWGRRVGIGPETIKARLRRGWSVHKALTHPLRRAANSPQRDEPTRGRTAQR